MRYLLACLPRPHSRKSVFLLPCGVYTGIKCYFTYVVIQQSFIAWHCIRHYAWCRGSIAEKNRQNICSHDLPTGKCTIRELPEWMNVLLQTVLSALKATLRVCEECNKRACLGVVGMMSEMRFGDQIEVIQANGERRRIFSIKVTSRDKIGTVKEGIISSVWLDQIWGPTCTAQPGTR